MSRLSASWWLCLSLAAAGPAFADEGCTDFKWDVSKERAVFATAPTPIAAGIDAKSAPELQLNHLYRLKLEPVTHVSYALPPGRGVPNAGGHAGIARLKVVADGDYRIALDVPVWVDVVADGALLTPKDYQGQHDCNVPHKIVVWELKHDKPLLIQVSATTAETALISVTAAPSRAQ